MIIYFSGTGNSKFVADRLGALLSDEVVDSRPLIKRGESGRFPSETPYIIVSPTYSWRVAPLFEEFLKRSSFSPGRELYFVLTCGTDTGNAPGYAAALSRELGLKFQGLWTLLMPENYVAMFPVPELAESRAIIAAATARIPGIAQYIEEGRAFPATRPSLLDRLKSGFFHNFFFRFMVRARAFYSLDRCVGCGRCVRLCVLNNIQLEDGRPVWGDECTHCMACICGCPYEAIEYGRKSLGKPRYWFPD